RPLVRTVDLQDQRRRQQDAGADRRPADQRRGTANHHAARRTGPGADRMDSMSRRTSFAIITALASRADAGPPRSLLPPPAHAEAFRTAWHDARACLVGDPMV